jgi:acetyl-CoA synthetase
MHGRVDDTMNLGGIKVSSAEIERLLNSLPQVQETAAVGVSGPEGGPSQLVIYTVRVAGDSIEKEEIMGIMQTLIKQHLNPLFKIHDVVLVESLPRTASNKVMHRVLRKRYTEETGN